MKKRLVSFLMAGMLLATFVACGSTSSSGGSSGAANSSGTTANTTGDKTVIEVWSEDRHDQEYVTSMIDQFNAQSDTIEVKLTIVSDDYVNMVSLAYSSGTAPDIAGWSGNFNTLINSGSGMFVPLDDYIAAAGEELEKVTAISEHMFTNLNVYNGNVYWIPSVVRSGVRAIYNENLVTEAGYTTKPTTIADMAELSRTITANGNGEYYGIAVTSTGPFGRLLQATAEMSGISPKGYDFVNGVFDFSDWKDLLVAFQELTAADSLFPGSGSQGVDAMRAQFATGTVGIWANASQEAGVFTDQFPVEDFEWTVALPPTLTGEIEGALTCTPSKGYMILSSSQNQDLAWEVIEYFLSEDFIKGYCENGYALPYSDYMSSIVDTSSAGRISDFQLTEYESVYPEPPLVAIDGDAFDTVLWNAAMGYVDIDSAIEDLNTRYNAALERDVASGAVQRLIIADYDPMHPDAGTVEYLSE